MKTARTGGAGGGSGPSGNEVLQFCRKENLEIFPAQAEALAQYLSLLTRWNKVMNLVGEHRWQGIMSNLAADSFHLAAFLRTLPLPLAPECWDLGAGAGLPGIPLRILWQEGRYTMVESRQKRALFLGTVLAHLRLPGVSVHQGRVESFMEGMKAHLILSRAFMPWPDMLALCRPHLAGEGFIVFMSNESITAQGWRKLGEHAYTAGASQRLLSAFAPE